MANERRIRENFRTGTILDDPLAFDATTIESAEFAALPEVGAGQHIDLVLDPYADGDGPEVVTVTSHGAGATTADVIRERRGTTAVEHAAGTRWSLNPLDVDYVTIVADATALAALVTPFVGQLAYQLDDCLLKQWNGVAWQPPWNLAWGVLDHAKNNGTGTLVGLVTVEVVALTTDEVTVPAGRRLRITMSASVSAAQADVFSVVRIRRGSTTGGVELAKGSSHITRANTPFDRRLSIIDEPPAGATKYVFTINSPFIATAATAPWSWSIEDVGRAADPS
jgi:hypothetical protein